MADDATDAARYRFLRDKADRDDDGCPFVAVHVFIPYDDEQDCDYETNWLYGDAVDAAVDAAMTTPSRPTPQQEEM